MKIGQIFTINETGEFYEYPNGDKKLYIAGPKYTLLKDHIICIPLIQDRTVEDYHNDKMAVSLHNISSPLFSLVEEKVEDMLIGFDNLIKHFQLTFDKLDYEFLRNSMINGEEISIIPFVKSKVLSGDFRITAIEKDKLFFLTIEKVL